MAAASGPSSSMSRVGGVTETGATGSMGGAALTDEAGAGSGVEVVPSGMSGRLARSCGGAASVEN